MILKGSFEQIVCKAHTNTKLVLILDPGSENMAKDLNALEDEPLVIEINPENPLLPM